MKYVTPIDVYLYCSNFCKIFVLDAFLRNHIFLLSIPTIKYYHT